MVFLFDMAQRFVTNPVQMLSFQMFHIRKLSNCKEEEKDENKYKSHSTNRSIDWNGEYIMIIIRYYEADEVNGWCK